MKISIMQPTYLPWLGYFDLMASSDRFVYYDDVQFINRSWHHKNKIKQRGGELLLTVPVFQKGKRSQNINEARIDNVPNWRWKHLKSIEHNYRKAAYYDRYIDDIRAIYQRDYDRLLELNLTVIGFLRKMLGIDTPISLSSELGIAKTEIRQQRVVEICRHYDADIVFEGVAGRRFADLDLFDRAGIKVVFHGYEHPVYTQRNGDFVPYLSALDLLLNEGPERSIEIIRAGRTPDCLRA